MSDGFPFDILFLGLVAAFLVMQLRKALGRRTGHEKPPPEIFGRDMVDKEEQSDDIIQLSGSDYKTIDGDPSSKQDMARKDEELQRTDEKETIIGLRDIQIADKNFDIDNVLKGAAAAFEMILEAFAAGDKPTLRPLLSDEVYDDFMLAIRKREESGEILESTLVSLNNAEILEASLREHTATLTVKFISDQISVTRNTEGEIISGDQEHIVQMVDIWMFSRNLRSHDPNWTLVETRSQN